MTGPGVDAAYVRAGDVTDPGIVRADAGNLPLPDESVDLIVTSPPYWALRSYQDGGQHYDGQIGAESTPAEYVDALIECTREWVRVLKPSGSVWVNLSDKYAGGGQGGNVGGNLDGGPHLNRTTATARAVPQGFRAKSLMLLPQRYAIGCIDDLGLILRAEVLWSKPNGLPESVTDRVRRSHEQFFHFTKQPRYYAAVDEIREPHKMRPQRRPNGHKQRQKLGVLPAQTYSTSQRDELGVDGHPLGALPGSVWEVPTQPLRVPRGLEVDHFAAFPPDLVKRIILGWSPPGICTECGAGRRPVVDKPGLLGGDNNPESRNGSRSRSTIDGGSERWQRRIANPDRITGYACACPEPTAPTRPALVVDPFGGTGTTALVASVHGRRALSFDLSGDYGRLARWRTTDPGERARALGVPKPPPVVDGQLELA